MLSVCTAIFCDLLTDKVKTMIEQIKKMRERIMTHQETNGFETIYDFLNEDLDELEKIAKDSGDIHSVSGIFIVNNSGIPMSYHKSKKGAEKAVEEWYNSGIEAAKKVSYDKIELSE